VRFGTSGVAVAGAGDADGLTLLDVRKSFGGVEVLRGVSLRVRPGTVVALLGPNGAGKTTLLRVAAGIARPASGRIVVDGKDLDRDAQAARSRVGYAPERPVAYGALTALENLTFFGRLYGLSPAAATERAHGALKAAGLAQRSSDPAGTLSHGMLQRLSFARATIHKPTVLLLDEPFEGLDATHSDRLAGDLRERAGRATLFTTHVPDTALEVADQVALLDRGQLVTLEPSASLTQIQLRTRLRNLGGD
jgi:ABC-type multidrug transport system ATPase subunit